VRDFFDPDPAGACPRCLSMMVMEAAESLLYSDARARSLSDSAFAAVEMLGTALIPQCHTCGYWTLVPPARFAH